MEEELDLTLTKSYLRLLRLTVLLSLMLPVALAICAQFTLESPHALNIYKVLGYIAIVVLPAYVLLEYFLRRKYDVVDRMGRDQALYLDEMSPKFVDLAIVVSAGVALFLELAVIRWQGEDIPLFAFYKNFSLLACFAGLGLGFALSARESIPLILTIPTLAFQMGLFAVLRHEMSQDWLKAIWDIPFAEQLHMGLAVASSLGNFIAIYFFLAVVFLLTVIAFIPVGQLCGRLMMRREKLSSYGLNLLGSILGVLIIMGMSFMWAPPVIWFGVCFACLLFFFRFSVQTLLLGTLSAFLAMAILSWPMSPGQERIHSPYQLLERGSGERGLMSIRAGGHYHQRVHDLSLANANRNTDPALKSIADYYELPYKIFGKPADNVAVVGAGTGNDVAAALRFGAKHVDAIEIDPAILNLGELYHPERPYANPRVRKIVTDARTFMRENANQYDLIVYGLLDSHTLLSHASSVRLDSFVYTVEGLREARSRLNPGGLVSLSFCKMSKQMARKIYLMMKKAFGGKGPICIQAGYDGSIIYLQAPNHNLTVDGELLKQAGFYDITRQVDDEGVRTDVSDDDWPFFYMPVRVYPFSYFGIFGLILLLSVTVTYNFIQQNPAFGNWSFFFLGSGFLLIETKAITELGLAFGNTWHVIGIVICGILFMAFLANYMVRSFVLASPTIWFIMLMGSLGAGYIVSGYGGFGSSISGKIMEVGILTCPVFFSGVVFSILLRDAKDISSVMAINLIGAITGGILEYNSMYFGFRFLYLLAIALYLLALVSFYVSHKVRPGTAS